MRPSGIFFDDSSKSRDYIFPSYRRDEAKKFAELFKGTVKKCGLTLLIVSL